MMKVSLNGAEFFAYHGFYPEEQILGNRFLLDIEVEFEPAVDMTTDEINRTVNYEHLYNIAEAEMKQTKKLLETVAQSICDTVRSTYPYLKRIKVELKKLNPPLKGKVAYSSVTVINEG